MKTRLSFLVIIFSVVLLWPIEFHSEILTTKITITVTNQEAGLPLDSVRVTFAGIDNSENHQGYTDSNGSITFESQPTGVSGDYPTTPNEFALSNPYPIPSNQHVNVEFANPQTQKVIISLYNILGQEVLSYSQNSPQGNYKVNLQLGGLSRGLYVVRIQAGKFTGAQKKL